jgi:histidinol-phosphate aminotransferase
MPLTVRPAIASLPSYKAGKSAPPGAGGGSYKLSSNENPYPPLPGVLAAVELACQQMNRYPDMGNTAITEAVAGRFGLGTDRVAFGTGSVAVLYHLLQAVCDPGDEVIFAWRSFEAYPIAVQVTGAIPIPVALAPGARHDLDAIRARISPATKAILICTPNNPTGPTVRHDDLVAFIDSVPDHILILVDEAYVEFVTDKHAVRGPDLLDRANVVVLRTFSKAYGLAGFRVGFCLGEPGLITAARSAALPFGVSVPAQAAVIASLAAEKALLERVDLIVTARAAMVAELRALEFDVPEAQGNFVWLPAGPSTLEYAETFATGGVMVRPYAAGDPGDGVRITVGEPAANRLVLEIAATLPR